MSLSASAYPNVMEAIHRADLLYLHENLDRMITANPANAAALNELFEHLKMGGEVSLMEQFPPQGQSPAQAQQPAAAPMQPSAQPPAQPAQQGDMHVHQCQMGPDGNGQTDAGMDGHLHMIRGGQIMAANGHTHDAGQMQAQQQAKPPMQAAQPQAAPFPPSGQGA